MRSLIRPSTHKKKKAAKTPRKRRSPRWRWVGSGFLAALVFGLLAGIGWALASGWAAAKRDALIAWTVEQSVTAGLTVRNIEIQGLKETTRESALAALAVRPGEPILTFDPETAKAALETLPWVRSAAVERRLPDRIRLHLVERRPLALWQQAGRLALIDEEGVVILREGLGRFRELPVVIGEMAPEKAHELFATLKSEPELLADIASATLIGKRRWNLKFHNGVEVYLPEDGVAGAWANLAEYERLEGITKRKIAAVDLRLKDRVVIRLLSDAANHGSERET